MNKILNIVGVVIAIVAIGAGVYSMTQKEVAPLVSNENPVENEELKEWKTYKNEEYGFEFKYPENWIMETETNSDVTTIIARPNYQIIDEQVIQPINLSVGISNKNIIVDRGNIGWDGITLSGKAALDTGWKTDLDRQDRVIVISNTPIYIGVGYSTLKTSVFPWYLPEDSKDVLDKILSTFKFTK